VAATWGLCWSSCQVSVCEWAAAACLSISPEQHTARTPPTLTPANLVAGVLCERGFVRGAHWLCLVAPPATTNHFNPMFCTHVHACDMSPLFVHCSSPSLPHHQPGAPEIDRLVRQLQGSSRLASAVGRAGGVRVLPLHGGLPPAVQVSVWA
jgi:hypothetical protein